MIDLSINLFLSNIQIDIFLSELNNRVMNHIYFVRRETITKSGWIGHWINAVGSVPVKYLYVSFSMTKISNVNAQ